MIMVLATPTPPTRSAIPPSPSSSVDSAPSVAAFAWSAADGSLTSTFCGLRGSTVGASSFCTWRTEASVDRSYTAVGCPSKPSSCCAAAQPTSADRSISGASGIGPRTPTTVKYRSPIHTCCPGPVTPSRSAATRPSTTDG